MPRYAFPAETVGLGSAGTGGMLLDHAAMCRWEAVCNIRCWLIALAPRASRPRTSRPGKSHLRTTIPGTMPLTWCPIVSQHRCHRTSSHRIFPSPTKVLTAIELDSLQDPFALAPKILGGQLEFSDDLGSQRSAFQEFILRFIEIVVIWH